jgi:hypothetical protein
MVTETDIRSYAHQLVDRMDLNRLEALLELLDEDYFTPEEIARIKEASNSDEWYDWRGIRNDL